MATSTGQRVGIWVIAAAMIVGTLAGFLALILAPQNEAKDQEKTTVALEKYQKELAESQKKVDAQAAELSKKYYDTFSEYKDLPEAFDAKSVKKLTTKDLKVGTGETLKEDTAYSAYYIGWNPKGKVFDQSIDGKTLKTPIPGGNLIEGWNEGVIGMKIGGIRVLSIPSEKAYGEAGSGEDIPKNSPIKFVVMVIKTPETIPQPEIPAELQQQ